MSYCVKGEIGEKLEILEVACRIPGLLIPTSYS
jgi:hypothetical protein